MTIPYEWECPNCGSYYCGDIDSDTGDDEKDFTCEDCGEKMHVYAEIDVTVTVS